MAGTDQERRVAPGSGAPDDVTDRIRMPLLDRITTGALDEEYQQVAQQRAASGEPAATRLPHRTAAVVVAIFGLLIVTAAVQTSRNAEVAEAGRVELIDQVNGRRDDLRAAQGRISDLRTENGELADARERVITQERTVSARQLLLAGTTGYAPVSGPGVRITVDDSPDGTSDGIVRDEDLAILANGLWTAGAEAIAVNGQRLTGISPIRNVNGAIHIRTQPLRPPYQVLAVGSPNTLQARFAEAGSGAAWYALVRTFGLEFTMENAQNLSLPAARQPTLRSAVQLADENAPKIEETP
ncbi:DUF881 domain-containing protein [Nocardioides donggukensis]|uniref:DUF881 domain-containing protein n=1 Tax=Nocardioides donggukensis TaxID=2774019 RepID=A0A927K2J4_9ACTN|nr:DUF881 domain-containing protein [Nocardioides donggukensis]MBD8869337.1 DUF881 domain-containing protein [Nocardioides donggukensis]